MQTTSAVAWKNGSGLRHATPREYSNVVHTAVRVTVSLASLVTTLAMIDIESEITQ